MFSPSLLKNTKVNYKSFFKVTQEIGGTFTFIHGLIFIIIIAFIIRDWENSLIMATNDNPEILSTYERHVFLQKIQDRVSFKGIFNLHDDLQIQNEIFQKQIDDMKLKLEFDFQNKLDVRTKIIE